MRIRLINATIGKTRLKSFSGIYVIHNGTLVAAHVSTTSCISEWGKTTMPENDHVTSDSDTPSAAEGLPEAFQSSEQQNGPEVKEVYDRGGGTTKKRTSTGLNIADEGSIESFPASDPPSPMAGEATLDSTPNAG
jgi:hypothetical protein